MKRYLITFLLSFIVSLCNAQNSRFVTQGEIEYEKSVNMYAIIGKGINKSNEIYLPKAIEKYKEEYPQFKKLKSTLLFSNGLTYFIPEKDNQKKHFFDEKTIVGQHNLVFSDLVSNRSTIRKDIFNKILLIDEPIKKIEWKLTDEFRDIAGYECRRANAIILDSIYVVAFFSERIPVAGGPESFGGLPGMILGLALPHENTTWFATKVIDRSIPKELLKKPNEGKPTSYKDLVGMILEASKAKSDNTGDYKAFFF